MEVMDHLYYTKEHEWVSIDDGAATVGITEYAQDALGDITFIELPALDLEVEQFEQIASVESVKAATDVYSPLSGKVIDVNAELEGSPEILNKSCYDLGWIAKLQIVSEDETSRLMSAEEYRSYLESLE